ncbi:MAG TPA: dienelactone hydrolase family protein [Pseudolabrys sp.]|jgi:carboxymethylenebutenolidase
MPGKTIQIHSRTGNFDCYLAIPQASGPVPAVVLASAVHGVDKDLRELADEFASHGFIAAAPDLFWRTTPGPLTRADGDLPQKRSQPRAEKIKTGEADMIDTLASLRQLPEFNGRAAAMGFCYGGPYAILGPKRLGYAAGISCHGTRMQDYIGELEGIAAPICIIWGDEDNQAPPEVLDAYRAVPPRMSNVELHIFPGVKHAYMMPDAGAAYDKKTREFSMARALAILNDLRGGGERLRKAS